MSTVERYIINFPPLTYVKYDQRISCCLEPARQISVKLASFTSSFHSWFLDKSPLLCMHDYFTCGAKLRRLVRLNYVGTCILIHTGLIYVKYSAAAAANKLVTSSHLNLRQIGELPVILRHFSPPPRISPVIKLEGEGGVFRYDCSKPRLLVLVKLHVRGLASHPERWPITENPTRRHQRPDLDDSAETQQKTCWCK